MKADFQLPKFHELAEAKLSQVKPKDKIITLKISVEGARMMVDAEKGKKR